MVKESSSRDREWRIASQVEKERKGERKWGRYKREGSVVPAVLSSSSSSLSLSFLT